MEDIWTPLQFDSAVCLFGTWCEGKLADYDFEAKRYKYSLEELLAEQNKQVSLGEFVTAMKAIPGVSVRKLD